MSFNEAAVGTADGRCRNDLHHGDWHNRFNEAAVGTADGRHEMPNRRRQERFASMRPRLVPRMGLDGLFIFPFHVLASMRPRLVPRMGVVPASRSVSVRHGFNEAAVGTADGRQADTSVAGDGAGASMRPRLVPRMGPCLESSKWFCEEWLQ